MGRYGELRTSDPCLCALHHTPGRRTLLLRAAQEGTTHVEVQGGRYKEGVTYV